MSEQARIETAVEATIDNCEVLRLRLAKYEDADGNPITTVAEQAREISSLRNIISECATACGAAVSVECSEEFMAMLPDEIRTVMTGKSLEIERLSGIVNKAWNKSHVLESGSYIPGALDAWKRPVLQHLPYGIFGSTSQTANQYCNGWNDAGGYWKAHADDLLAELAAMKAQPSGVVQWPDADEIMQMAFEEGQPGDDASGYYFELEEFDLFLQRLMEEVARLNSSPVTDNGAPE